ncbi:hypothetical protein BDP55DRAFT_634593 [Colletotrichum godetiae]|uniref:Uncharacterized protein n=1 Tax=Colletotrichum godetiae TaxID=1209918 RepID=A0AAJ0AFA4_9PEZI|nr:uncharacterized protein BDP55DRAFT_634593 [Colletotrichum godetiae]KAK1672837.1 hypothetical protein BDP55DRAFT_634593 [Colletotrichum godetiae]
MSLQAFFRGSMHIVRFFQMATLAFTTYTVYYAVWIRRQEYRNAREYHDMSNEMLLDMNEVAMVIACVALGIEIFINSDFNKPSDSRLSTMSLAIFSVGLIFYATVPAAKEDLKQNGALMDLSHDVDFSTIETALWRTSMTYGVITWASSVVFVLSTIVDQAERVILQKSGISGVVLHAVDQKVPSHGLRLEIRSPV